MKAEQFMVINSENGQQDEILGKYMYFSLPKLIIKADKVKEICEQIGFPVGVREKISITDAFRSATGEIYERIVEKNANGTVKTCLIYCRDNLRVTNDMLSRELVEETLYQSTNNYRKLANITLDKATGEITLSDIDFSSDRDIYGYFEQTEKYFKLYQDCIGNRSIETMAEKYISDMHAISISARGYHYFVPKAHMHKISLLEDFMELIAKENLFTYANRRDSKYISMNSMFVADDEKQRSKMAYEFYLDIGREVDEYQRRITKLIQNGNSSQRILDRWELKIRSLENKKREYETILKKDLSGIDEDFAMLRDMCDQFKLHVRNSQIFSIAA